MAIVRKKEIKPFLCYFHITNSTGFHCLISLGVISIGPGENRCLYFVLFTLKFIYFNSFVRNSRFVFYFLYLLAFSWELHKVSWKCRCHSCSTVPRNLFCQCLCWYYRWLFIRIIFIFSTIEWWNLNFLETEPTVLQ